jgi:hypothetical protein
VLDVDEAEDFETLVVVEGFEVLGVEVTELLEVVTVEVLIVEVAEVLEVLGVVVVLAEDVVLGLVLADVEDLVVLEV